MDDAIRAVVQKVVSQGRHGAYAVATSEQIEGSVTFSLEPTVWQEKEFPEEGSVVHLWKLRQKRAGWRAKAGRFTKPSDEHRERSNEMVQQVKRPFKPYLVEGGRDGKDIFRIVEVREDVTREQVEQLFEQLPIGFCLRKEGWQVGDEILKEPLEVYVEGAIVSVYPPRHRVITCTSVSSWKHAEVVSKMKVDNIADLTPHGQGQVRSCIHFDPQILGIANWPNTTDVELELDIFVYPKGTERERKLKPPSFGKHELRNLLNLIAGKEGELTPQLIGEWRELILYAVGSMRSFYDNLDIPEDNSTRQYYERCWRQIEEAHGDNEKLASALGSLIISIQWQ